MRNSKIVSIFAEKLATMDRIEFSNLLVQTKINSGVSTSELMFALKIMPSQLKRIEKAENNYSLDKAIGYLHILNQYIHVANDYFEVDVNKPEDFVEAFRHLKTDVPTTVLARKLDASVTMLNRILSYRSAITIDVFLSICTFYNLKIEICGREVKKDIERLTSRTKIVTRVYMSAMCKKLRESRNISMADASRLSGIHPNQIERMESAKLNYGMDNFIRYVNSLNAQFILIDGRNRYQVSNCEFLAQWLKNKRGNETQYSLAEDLNISQNAITKIESGKSKMTVDIFITSVFHFGCRIKIKDKDE